MLLYLWYKFFATIYVCGHIVQYTCCVDMRGLRCTDIIINRGLAHFFCPTLCSLRNTKKVVTMTHIDHGLPIQTHHPPNSWSSTERYRYGGQNYRVNPRIWATAYSTVLDKNVNKAISPLKGRYLMIQDELELDQKTEIG